MMTPLFKMRSPPRLVAKQDEITVRVLEEAQRVSAGDMAASSSCPAGEAGSAATAVAGPAAAPDLAAPAAAGQAAGVAAPGGERRGKQAQANKSSALTSLDIHKVGSDLWTGQLIVKPWAHGVAPVPCMGTVFWARRLRMMLNICAAAPRGPPLRSAVHPPTPTRR